MPVGIIITMMTTTTRRTITMTEAAALARLLCFASPAFPTGGFAYSHGIEWAVESGDVCDEAGLRAWIDALLLHGSGRSDVILLRHAYRAAETPSLLTRIADLAAAICPSPERRLESLGQGIAFAAAAHAWGGETLDASYPVAFGVMAARQGIGEDDACIGYLAAWLNSLVSAGVRLVPLGQSAGLRVLASLEPPMLAVIDTTRDATLDDVGSACFRADIASMKHETQYSRMFRS